MNSVDMDKLESVYNITSVNPEIIKSGVIDYREGGILNITGQQAQLQMRHLIRELR
ncbi:MAG: hypothetical protein ACLS49_12340 [Christensenellales bacterium]